jgi:hypothetical protein
MKAGDLVLIRSKGIASLVNRVGQTIVSGRIARGSHVQLCVAPGVVIDATTKDGVTLRNVVREVICERLTDHMCNSGTMLVMRPPAGNWDPATGQALVAGMIHIGKKYNWKFLMPHASDDNPESANAGSAFCSELVALLLRTWGLLKRKPSRTLPVNLQQLLSKGAWSDVTTEWAGNLRDLRIWAESEDLQVCRQLGSQLWQGNQQIHLIVTLKLSADALKAWE